MPSFAIITPSKGGKEKVGLGKDLASARGGENIFREQKKKENSTVKEKKTRTQLERNTSRGGGRSSFSHPREGKDEPPGLMFEKDAKKNVEKRCRLLYLIPDRSFYLVEPKRR